MLHDKALVYKKGVLAATLQKVNGGLEFSYLPEYSGLPVASTLPLGATVSRSDGRAPSFFKGLLPEGSRLESVAWRLKTSVGDDLNLLVAIGFDPIGDVQILPEGDLGMDESRILKLEQDTAGLDFVALRERYFGSSASGIPGVQDKVSAKMLNSRTKTSHLEYLVKFNPIQYPFVVENENFFLGLAKECGLQTSNFELLTDAHGVHALRLRRWDRVGANGNSVRLAAEDSCQLLNLDPVEKYNPDFLEVASAMGNMAQAVSATGKVLFQQLVFDWLIGNGDAHAKNFSLLEGGSGRFRVAPAYDLLCTRYYDDRTMALSIDGSNTGWDRKFLLNVAARMQVPAVLASRVIDKQLSVLSKVPELLVGGVLPFRRDLNADVAAFLKQRAKALA